MGKTSVQHVKAEISNLQPKNKDQINTHTHKKRKKRLKYTNSEISHYQSSTTTT